MSSYGQQIGRQPIRAGMHSYFRGPQQVNIYHKEVRNIYNGGMSPMSCGGYGNYGYCDPGLSTGAKWMIGLGAISSIGGAILGAIYGDNGGGNDTHVEEKQKNDAQPAGGTPLTREDVEDIVNNILQSQSAKEKKQAEEVAKLKEQSQNNYNYTAGAREVPGKNETTTYTVTAKNNGNGTYTGDTGYNIVAGKYKSADGKPLTNAEIKAIASKIFEGKALKVGDVELPNTVEVNGKTYNIDPKGEVKPSTYTLGNHEVYQGSARQEGSKWIPTLDGKDLEGEYATEAEAKAAAEAEGAKKKAATEGNAE